ncbi:hypothetical protein [Gloeobacter morelensis]|uniref:Uncharacterized protein n=1 Tax=Gloeobacter morelensis MG652769 TaxID=2781736 RepID=A0ABY3PNC7_9CYAN|nr:hypothetical protein [Gloeobacter morelensis]UFP95119.1 hypothetical protein ISF26_02375 [Gloeobacter morelensis MG652769]
MSIIIRPPLAIRLAVLVILLLMSAASLAAVIVGTGWDRFLGAVCLTFFCFQLLGSKDLSRAILIDESGLQMDKLNISWESIEFVDVTYFGGGPSVGLLLKEPSAELDKLNMPLIKLDFVLATLVAPTLLPRTVGLLRVRNPEQLMKWSRSWSGFDLLIHEGKLDRSAYRLAEIIRRRIGQAQPVKNKERSFLSALIWPSMIGLFISLILRLLLG